MVQQRSAPDEITAIPLTPPVGFDYDAAGNRLWMTDGLGRVDYVHNTWSRLVTETRLFNDFPGSSYVLSYDYNLAGQLNQVTDPFGKSINYAYDHAGQLTGVTGSNFAGIIQYASNIQYRAWKGLKHLQLGNGANIDYGYNARLQTINFGTVSYDYDADGRVHFVHFPDNPSFDRKYSYDHLGRLREGLSGSDARGEPYNPDDPPPYKQTYTYDVWANMTGRTNRYWTLEETPFAATYVNDRNTAWDYNAAGNVAHNLSGDYVYDTAGRMVTYNNAFLNQSYDGDGLSSKRVEFRPGLNDRATIYYVRSTVLGGQPITELSPDGFKRRTYVYAHGGDIARQEKIAGIPDQVQWIKRDPITGDDDITRDPLGGVLGNPNDVKFADYASLKGNAPTHDADADPFSPGSGCTLDGVPIDCSLASGMANNGGAVVAPWKSVFVVTKNGRSALATINPAGGDSSILVWEPGHDILDNRVQDLPDSISMTATHIDGRWLRLSVNGSNVSPQVPWGPFGIYVPPIPRIPRPPLPEEYRQILLPAVGDASIMLSKPNCASLFNLPQGVTPQGLLFGIATGLTGVGDLTFGITRALIPAAAETRSSTAERSSMRLPVSGRTVLRSTGVAHITINSGGEFVNGFDGRFGITDSEARALVLIHELGHAVQHIFGDGSSQMVFDGYAGDIGRVVSNINSSRVRRNCF